MLFVIYSCGIFHTVVKGNLLGKGNFFLVWKRSSFQYSCVVQKHFQEDVILCCPPCNLSSFIHKAWSPCAHLYLSLSPFSTLQQSLVELQKFANPWVWSRLRVDRPANLNFVSCQLFIPSFPTRLGLSSKILLIIRKLILSAQTWRLRLQMNITPAAPEMRL